MFASSAAAYGDPAIHPQVESYGGNVDPVGIRAAYDEAKRFGEAAVSVAAREWKLDARIARVFNTFGPRMRLDSDCLIPALLDALETGTPLPLHGEGSQTRSLTYVDDIVAGLLAVGGRPGRKDRPVQPGPGR